MSAILLVIIYLIFISLGLPDSFIGTCWPSISQTLNVSEGYQGVFTVTLCFFTVISAFSSVTLQKKMSTHLILTLSIFLTILGLIGIFFAPNIKIMIISLLPLGLGAGAIDAVLNNYVAHHYRATQLHFLHGFWSVGALITPIISSFFLVDQEGWRNAILVLAIIQSIILLLTLFSKSLWKKDKIEEETNEECIELSFINTFKIRGCISVLLVLFFFCAIEALIFSWFSSLMVFSNEVEPSVAAGWLSFVYLGYTISRIISGLLSNKVKDKYIVRIFLFICLIGNIFLIINKNLSLTPLITLLIGFGMGPIYPAVVHDTSQKFGKELSKNVLGVQIGCSYLAYISIGPLFGLVGEVYGFNLLPFVIIGIVFIILILFELSNNLTKDKTRLLDRIKNK